MAEATVILGDAIAEMKRLPNESIDAIITDPPYPEIDRPYGRLTEREWWDLMMGVCTEARRVLKPTGSAVFILQPNSRKVGSMRGWLWEFMAWVCREWNMPQDFWWWNYLPAPTVHANAKNGLAKPSLKACVWAGPYDCYRNQSEVLRRLSEATRMADLSNNTLNYSPSGLSKRPSRINGTPIQRGGSTPINVLPMLHDTANDAGSHGHGAGTPLDLAKWWTRYICPPGGTVLDPFIGSGTMGVAAMNYGCSIIGIEKMPKYYQIAKRRIEQAAMQPPLIAPQQPHAAEMLERMAGETR